MKGTYHGEMRVSYYHGETISEGNACKAVSKDSLTSIQKFFPHFLKLTNFT